MIGSRIQTLLAILLLAGCGKGSSGGSGRGAPAGALPAGWQSLDIGAVGHAGSAALTDGKFLLSGSGVDIWDLQDSFRFLHQAVSGDVSITARVLSLDPTNPWAKAGVMIRESLDPTSKFAMTVVTPGNGSSFQWREQTGQGCSLSSGPAVAAPYWVRLARSGQTFTASVSPDGAAWTVVGSRTIPMAAAVYVGLCVTAHDNAALAAASFDSLSVLQDAPAASLGPDVHLLQVRVADDKHGTFAGVYVQVVDPSIVPPSNRAPVLASIVAASPSVAPFGQVTLTASASDEDGDALRFAWIVPAGDVGGSSTSTETWTAPSQPGTYTLQCMVTDGHVWSGGTVTVQVNGPAGTSGPGNHAPAIRSLTASAVRVTQGQQVTLSVSAADVEEPVLSFKWYAATGGTIQEAGATATWTAPAPGTGRPAKAGLWILGTNTGPPGCPFPPSTAIPGMAFVGRAAVQQFCDTWMPAWAADGSLYSPWQDGVLTTEPFEGLGGWFGGTEPALNGWARIVGNDPQDLLIPSAGQVGAVRGDWTGRFPGAMFHHDGVLYYATHMTQFYTLGGDITTEWAQTHRWVAGPTVGWRTSVDGGTTWTETAHTPDSPLFPELPPGYKTMKFGPPFRWGCLYMVDFGRNQERSPDGKVYFVSAGSSVQRAQAQEQNDNQVFLCRVTPSIANINDLSKYEFYAGNGQWSSNHAQSAPIAEWPGRFTGATITWNPGLGKFLMISYSNGYGPEGSQFNPGDYDTFILESDALTGPWKMVTFLKSFGKQAYFPNLPSKFLSDDGRNAWLWYGANFMPFGREEDPPGSAYHMCQQRIRFLR